MSKQSTTPPVSPVALALAPKHNAWDRNPREGDRAWQLFHAFRQMAYDDNHPGQFTPRSTQVIAEMFGVTVGHVNQMSSQYNWIERCAAFDQYKDQCQIEAGQKAVTVLAKAHARLLAHTLELSQLETAKLLERSKADPGVSVLRPRELIALAEWTIKQQRLLTGQSTDNVALELDLSKLGIEELEQLLRLHNKAKGIIDTDGE